MHGASFLASDFIVGETIIFRGERQNEFLVKKLFEIETHETRTKEYSSSVG